MLYRNLLLITLRNLQNTYNVWEDAEFIRFYSVDCLLNFPVCLCLCMCYIHFWNRTFHCLVYDILRFCDFPILIWKLHENCQER
jgi:hypothetical protein